MCNPAPGAAQILHVQADDPTKDRKDEEDLVHRCEGGPLGTEVRRGCVCGPHLQRRELMRTSAGNYCIGCMGGDVQDYFRKTIARRSCLVQASFEARPLQQSVFVLNVNFCACTFTFPLGDLTFIGLDVNLDFILGCMQGNCDIKSRGRLGLDESDVQKIDILGRFLEYHS